MKTTIRNVIVAVAMFAPAFASASWSFTFIWGSGNVCTANYLQCLGGDVLYIINSILVPVLFAIAFIVFLYGIAKTYIFSLGNEEEVRKGHKLMLWGIIGFAIMVSIWGLVNIVSATFGLQGSPAPIPPVSYPI